MGNDCCTDRSSSKKTGSLEAFLCKYRDQLSNKNSELNRLKDNRDALAQVWLQDAEQRPEHVTFDAGEVVSVEFGGRTRDGEIERCVKPGVYRIKWVGANPNYAPPEDIPKERLKKVAPPPSWAESMMEAERANIFRAEMLGIWDEYVGTKPKLHRNIHDMIIRDYCRLLKKHLYEIWFAAGAARVPPKVLEDAKPQIQKALERKADDLLHDCQYHAHRMWIEMMPLATEAEPDDDILIRKDMFMERYYLQLMKHIPLTRLAAEALMQAMAESAMREINELRSLLHRHRYGW